MYKRRFESLNFLKAAVVLPALVFGTPYVQAAPSNCSALVQVINDLWVVRPDGTLINQITNDNQLKSAATFSSDGTLIAYSGASNDNHVTLVSKSGQVLANIDTQATDAITGLHWISPDILRIQEHVSPTSSLYRFVKVPSNSPSNASLLPGTPLQGGSCSKSPKRNDTACTQADAVVVNNRPIYYAPDPFRSATDLQVFTLAAGATITTSTSPAFGLEIGKIEDGVASLKVTPPDGNWQKSNVKFGDVMPIVVASAGSDGGSTVYGFQPLRARGDRDDHGTITLAMKKSLVGETVFERGPVWDPDGDRLAFVESNAIGERTLVLVRREMGDADEQKGESIGTTVLPIQGPIRSVQFLSRNQIQVEGQTQVYQASPPLHAKVGGQWSYTLSPALPTQISVTINDRSTITDVIGWACQ